MTINLSKGGNINLSKEAPGLSGVQVGLGWDTNKYDTAGAFDLDASVSLLNESGKLTSDTSFVFYNNTKDPSGSVEHKGDNRTGEGSGDDEVVNVDLSTVPENVKTIRFAVTIHEADERKQNFGMIDNAYIRILNPLTGAEIARYDLTEDFSTETCVIPGEFYRHNNDWKFKAIGAGYGGGLAAYVAAIQ